jgi:hypothetical protein
VVKGTEPYCPILSAASWPPLAPGDGHVHMASQDTTWGRHMAWHGSPSFWPATHGDYRAFTTSTQFPSWSLEATTPAAYSVHAQFPWWPIESTIPAAAHVLRCICMCFSGLDPWTGQKSYLWRSSFQGPEGYASGDLDVPPAEGQKSCLQGMKVLAQRTKAGCH